MAENIRIISDMRYFAEYLDRWTTSHCKQATIQIIKDGADEIERLRELLKDSLKNNTKYSPEFKGKIVT